MSDIGKVLGDVFSGLIFGAAICGAGAVVAVGGIAYGANKLYFEPNARSAEFNNRAQNVLASRNLKVIMMDDFKQAAAGCADPLYGAKFTAVNANNQVVAGVMCISRDTEISLRLP